MSRRNTIGKAKQYESEAALCAAFIATLDPHWTAYPEANGFDIFLVHKSGYQIGVEAKRSASTRLLAQLAGQTRRYRHRTGKTLGPDVVAALVPQTRDEAKWRIGAAVSHDFAKVARSLDAAILFPGPVLLFPGRPRPNNERMKVPEVIGDDIAGSPCGASCTPWKIAAIKVCLEMKANGFVTTETFKKFEIKPALWVKKRWLKSAGKTGRITRYEKDIAYTDFADLHPKVVEQLAEKGG